MTHRLVIEVNNNLRYELSQTKCDELVIEKRVFHVDGWVSGGAFSLDNEDDLERIYQSWLEMKDTREMLSRVKEKIEKGQTIIDSESAALKELVEKVKE